MRYELTAVDPKTKARAGVLHTDHGDIQTPIFMPVGTCGTVKAVNQQQLADEVKAQIILGNTYHLYLRPGCDTLYKAGGLHRFISWNRPILTDSGGYQVFSLAKIRKIKEEGVTFHSHIDGSPHLFTPESVIDTQRIIGSDIMMALDECTPGDADFQYARKSLALTKRWLLRGLKHYRGTEPLYGHHQMYFPIVQGCVYPELRRDSAKFVTDQDCEGYAIGGLAVGEPAEKMYEMIEVVNEILPTDRPRYLMGVGTPENLLEAIERGVDMFDCVMPTRVGRNARLYTKQGRMNMRNRRWADDFSPLEEDGAAEVDRIYSKAYLRHLFMADEILALEIASVHNLAYYLWLVGQAREHIMAGDFADWKRQTMYEWKKHDEEISER